MAITSVDSSMGRRYASAVEQKSGLSLPEEELLRAFSHNLRSPLHSVRSLLGTVAEGYTGGLSDQSLEFVKRALVRLDEMELLLKDLIDYQRVRSGDRGQLEPLDLAVLAAEAVDSLADEIQCFGIPVESVPVKPAISEGHHHAVSGSREWLHEALRRAITAALRNSPAGSTVRLQMITEPATSDVCVCVLDQGPPVLDCEKNRLFEPFFMPSKRRSEGSGGLDLALIRAIVTDHGGTVSMRLQAGLNCLMLCLPSSEQAPQRDGD